ncbi:MAG: S8 family serine peptidase [Anaerolineae bacterium]
MTHTVLIYANARQRARLAKQGISVLTEYEDYVLARADDEQLVALQARGFEVEIYEAAPAPGGLQPVGTRSITAAGAAEETPPAGIVGPPPAAYGPGRHYYLVDFIGPIKSEWLDELQAHGIVLHEPMPPAGYIVALDQPAYDWLAQGLPYVRSLIHYSPEMRMSPELMDAIGADPLVARGMARGEAPAAGAPEPPGVERVPATFLVRFFAAEDLVQALPAIRTLGGKPSDPAPGSTMITVGFSPDDPELAAKVEQLAHLHGVRAVEPHVLRQLRNDIAARLMGAQEVHNPSGLSLSGRGEIVGVADSGLDTGDPAAIHPDLKGRVTAIYSWPVAPDWASVVTNVGADDGPADTRSGHGTHVAGSACGDGTASLSAQNDPVRGLAYEATLVFQAVEQRLEWTPAYRNAYYQRYRRYPPEYGLAGLPVDLTQLFQQAYQAGARIHSNSWGGGDFGAYDNYSEAVDRFSWEHKDFLILFAAGNDGSDGNRDGVVDEGSITPPGTAKNCLTVGAAESLRAQGGYQLPYGQLWPNDFPVNPLRSDKPSDDPDDIAAFSSRGPARDGRVKPDLVAPGTNILSMRSQALVSGVTPGWGTWSKSNKYMFNGGTSMATPLTAGAAAVVRQYLREVRRRANPSAALIKATLIHGARYRRYRHVAADGKLYDFAQGWGHVNLADVLAPAGNVKVYWYDRRIGLRTGQSWKWSCWVNSGRVPLAFTLVWTDYPGSAGVYPNLVNDLDLVVVSPAGKTYYGNSQPGQSGGTPDRVNNVERIVIPEPEVGRYRIRVRGFNVPRGPQDFALVYSGDIR